MRKVVGMSMLVLAAAATLAACTAREEVRRVELHCANHAITLAMPRSLILHEADDHSYATLGLSYPSLTATPPGELPDLFLVLKAAPGQTAAERLEASDLQRTGATIPRLVGQSAGRKDFQYLVTAKSAAPVNASVYRTESGWLSVVDAGKPFESIDFDRRFETYFELNYKVSRKRAADPLVVDRNVVRFIESLVVVDRPA